MPYAAIPLLLALLCIYLGRRLITAVVFFAYMSVEGMLKLLSNYHPVVHIGLDIIVLSTLGTIAMSAIIQRRATLPALPWTRLILLHASWVILQVFHPNSPGLIPSIGSFKIHLAMIPLYFFGAAVVRERRDIVRFFSAMSAVVIVTSGVALVQYALGPSSLVDLSARYAVGLRGLHEWRPFGTTAGPGGASVYAFLVTPLAAVLLALPHQRTVTRTLAYLAIALSAGAFIVSGVRQLVLATGISILVMAAIAISRRRGRAVGVLLVVAVLGVSTFAAVDSYLRPLAQAALQSDPELPDIWRQRSVLDRMITLGNPEIYLRSRSGAAGRIWFRVVHYPLGAGLARTGSAAGAFAEQLSASPVSARISREVGWSDNFFADMIVETGIPGMVMLTTILIGMIVGAARLALRSGDPVFATTSAAIAGMFLAFLVMSWGSQPLMGNPILAFFWFLSGVLAAMRRMEIREADEATASESVPALVPAGRHG